MLLRIVEVLLPALGMDLPWSSVLLPLHPPATCREKLLSGEMDLRSNAALLSAHPLATHPPNSQKLRPCCLSRHTATWRGSTYGAAAGSEVSRSTKK